LGNKRTHNGSLELYAPGTARSAAITAGMHKTGTIEGIRTLATCIGYLKPRAGTFVISLMSNDGEIRFRLLRSVVESEP
jgi:hypothetical protein